MVAQPDSAMFRSYLFFWSGQLVSLLGSSIAQFVIIWHARNGLNHLSRSGQRFDSNNNANSRSSGNAGQSRLSRNRTVFSCRTIRHDLLRCHSRIDKNRQPLPSLHHNGHIDTDNLMVLHRYQTRRTTWARRTKVSER